jgi:hypothetical protein
MLQFPGSPCKFQMDTAYRAHHQHRCSQRCRSRHQQQDSQEENACWADMLCTQRPQEHLCMC